MFTNSTLSLGTCHFISFCLFPPPHLSLSLSLSLDVGVVTKRRSLLPVNLLLPMSVSEPDKYRRWQSGSVLLDLQTGHTCRGWPGFNPPSTPVVLPTDESLPEEKRSISTKNRISKRIRTNGRRFYVGDDSSLSTLFIDDETGRVSLIPERHVSNVLPPLRFLFYWLATSSWDTKDFVVRIIQTINMYKSSWYFLEKGPFQGRSKETSVYFSGSRL